MEKFLQQQDELIQKIPGFQDLKWFQRLSGRQNLQRKTEEYKVPRQKARFLKWVYKDHSFLLSQNHLEKV